MVGRGKQKQAPTPSLTVHQIVAYNFRRAREEAGWTQTMTSERLEPHLGYRLNQAGVSAIEKTFDSERRRNIDVAEVAAFARCFGLPISWFFVPPTGLSGHILEPVPEHYVPWDSRVVSLLTEVLGSPAGWRSLVGRVRDLMATEGRRAIEATETALVGRKDSFGDQIDLRRRALMQVTLARRVGPHDEAVTKLASALVDLVKLTPEGFLKLRDKDLDQAIELLAEGDRLVADFVQDAEAKRAAGEPSQGGYDDLMEIDLREALELEGEE